MERIGRYRLGQRLGAGSFATVWKGHDDDLDVPVGLPEHGLNGLPKVARAVVAGHHDGNEG